MPLSDIAGQERAIAVLSRALAAGRLAHALLFDGPESVGKRTTARALGLALICPQQPGVGCGSCDVCARVLAGHHPDVMLFDACALPELAKASSEKSAVKYAARTVFPYALASPHEAPARLLIIDNADELSPDVQNTLLKTLEEPRRGVFLVLITAARDRLLPTILSRTQRIRFGPLPTSALVQIARHQGLPPDRAATAAALSGGSVARLVALVTAEGDVGPFDEAAALRTAAASTSVNVLFDAASAHGDKESKERLPDTLTLLATVYRDAMVVAAGAPDLMALPGRGDELTAIAEAFGPAPTQALPGLGRSLRAVVEAQEALVANVNGVSLLERLLFQLRRHGPQTKAAPAKRAP
jgi:DNA polymerase-3 subunit delta'